MNRMSWRVLRTELLRGAAPAALAVTLGALGALPDVVSVQQSLLFVGVAGIAIVLAAARRKVWAAFPGAMAIGVAFPLLLHSDWETDPAAAELVCVDGVPDVCLRALRRFGGSR